MTNVERILLTMIIVFQAANTGCRNDRNRITISTSDGDLNITLVKGKINYLRCFEGDSLTSEWPVRYPVYDLKSADVNNDGRNDVAIMVYKDTRYDPVKRKRLFLFEVRNKSIIPLWLGSALSHELEDFTFRDIDKTTIVRTIEKEKNKNYLVAEYEWYGFGLSFREFVKREISLSDAQELLNEN